MLVTTLWIFHQNKLVVICSTNRTSKLEHLGQIYYLDTDFELWQFFYYWGWICAGSRLSEGCASWQHYFLFMLHYTCSSACKAHSHSSNGKTEARSGAVLTQWSPAIYSFDQDQSLEYSTGNLYRAVPMLWECCSQVEAGEVSNSSKKNSPNLRTALLKFPVQYW